MVNDCTISGKGEILPENTSSTLSINVNMPEYLPSIVK